MTSPWRASAAWSSAAATLWASPWPCCCSTRTAPSPSATAAPKICRKSPARADILVSAVGKSRFVTADMVKPGAVVIRRGHEPGRERQALRRRGLCRGGAGGLVYHPGARRRWAHDHRHAAEKYGHSRQAPKRPALTRLELSLYGNAGKNTFPRGYQGL